jgi:hypothetical protein
MLAIILSAQAFARRAQTKRLVVEAQRLRVALAIVLAALREAYEEDLAILAGSRDLPLISGRNQIALLRTQLARLTSLDAPEVEAVMAASVAAERVEMDLPISGRRVGDVAIAISSGQEVKRTLEASLREAHTALLTAELLLRPQGILPRDRASDHSPGMNHTPMKPTHGKARLTST